MLEWIYQVRPGDLPCEGPQDTPFPCETQICEGSPGIIAKALYSAFSEIRVGTAVTELGSLNAIGIIGSWDGRGQEAALDHQRHGGCSYHKDCAESRQ